MFALGLFKSFRTLPRPAPLRALLRPAVTVPWNSAFGWGRACLLVTAAALMTAGAVIMTVGMTTVFVPQDLEFMGLSADELSAINPRLVPLIAHDRAGFGGGLFSTGLIVLFCVWCGAPSRSLFQVLCVAGAAGFGTAITVHPVIGYLSFTHVAPAVVVVGVFVTGLALCFKPMVWGANLNTNCD